jgi:hypothetical protein
MSNEIEPIQPYDPEVEKRRIEANETIQKDFQAQQKYIHEGWQGVVNKAIEAIKNNLLRNKEIEARNFIGILIVIVIIFISASLLTWQKIVPAEGLTFLAGTIVGYLISLARPIGN